MPLSDTYQIENDFSDSDCAVCSPGSGNLWNGKFLRVAGSPPTWSADTSDGDEVATVEISEVATKIVQQTGGTCLLQITCYPPGGNCSLLWKGVADGTDPAATYTRIAGSLSTPSTLTASPV